MPATSERCSPLTPGPSSPADHSVANHTPLQAGGEGRPTSGVHCCLFSGLWIGDGVAPQGPSYSKDIRPFLTKYCLECHNARTLKGTLSLETYKTMMDGSDGGPVIVAGKPDKSRLVLQCEGADKPKMPPAKAKFQPTKDEIAQLRAWVFAGAKDDGASVKVELPNIKANAETLPPVRAMGYARKGQVLYIARDRELTAIHLAKKEGAVEQKKYWGNVTAIAPLSETAMIGVGEPGESGVPLMYLGILDNMVGGRPGYAWHKDTILDMVSHPRRGWLASSSYDGKIILQTYWLNQQWASDTIELKEHSDAVYGLAFSPDGKLLASVSADRAMKVFDVEKGKLLYTLGHATDWLYCVAWSPDGKYLVSGGVDKSIRVYEPTPTGAKLRQSVFAHEGPVLKVVFSSDSRTLYSVGEDRIVKAWDIEKMIERKVYDKQPETVLCLALREDAEQIIVGRYDGIVQLIDMKTGKIAHEFGKPEAPKKPAKAKKESPVLFQQKNAEPISAKDAGSSPATGQKITPPANLVGTLDRAGAVHFYRFDAKKGQPLGVRLTADGKAKFDPVLIVADMFGRILAESYDGHLGHTFAEAGSYAIGVRDRDYRGGADFKYRLQLGEIPVVTAVFPMGLQRGTKGDIHLDGVFLPKKMIAISVPKTANPGQMIPLVVGNGVLGKAQIIVGEFPEVSAIGNITVPGTANGRIAQDNQKDLWSFHAKKGERLIVEVNARRLGSRLDSVIEILDQNDQPVPRAVLRSQAKTHVTFRDHDSAQGNIRIETWSELATNDLLFVGNELMKIKELPTHPDADCNFFAADGKRLAYLDTTPTHHANNTPMYKVSVHPPGTTLSAERLSRLHALLSQRRRRPRLWPRFTHRFRSARRRRIQGPHRRRTRHGGRQLRLSPHGAAAAAQLHASLFAENAKRSQGERDSDHDHRRAHRRFRWADHRQRQGIARGPAFAGYDDRSGKLCDDGRALRRCEGRAAGQAVALSLQRKRLRRQRSPRICTGIRAAEAD